MTAWADLPEDDRQFEHEEAPRPDERGASHYPNYWKFKVATAMGMNIMPYFALKLNFWPPIAASYIKPPFVWTKTAMPLL